MYILGSLLKNSTRAELGERTVVERRKTWAEIIIQALMSNQPEDLRYFQRAAMTFPKRQTILSI
jgi:hypothetical protein